MLPRIQPIAPKRIQAPFDHTEFVFELKMDGWRCLAYLENGACRLISRKQNQFKSFSLLAASVAKLRVQNAVIDGEVVCLDAKGKSVFLDLKRPRKANAILYCFDLLWLNNEDLRNLPLVERKLRLRHLVRTSRNRSLLYASHMESQGVRLFKAICEQDCEGIGGPFASSISVTLQAPTSGFRVAGLTIDDHRNSKQPEKCNSDQSAHWSLLRVEH